VGFSTAVFGLLGVLAALRMRAQLPLGKRLTLRYWLPLGAAVALLGLTGSSPGSDLTAHFFGFIWGCALGYFSAFLAKYHENHFMQTFFAVITFSAIFAAWVSAFS
jgi:membrane associated rhomboid family serine protease